MNTKITNGKWYFNKILQTYILRHISAIPKGSIEIKFVDTVELKRGLYLWYGGSVVEIGYQGYTFHIEARGDVYAYLNEDDIQIAYVKDKNNNGNFYSQVKQYLKTDKELLKALANEHGKYKLSLEDSNWWECSVTDKRGVWHDIAWCLDADYILDAVIEVLTNMDSVIEDIHDVKKIRIYQIDLDLDIHRIAFMPHKYIQEKGFENPPASIYRMVFDGSAGTDNLENIFTIFNINYPEDYQGRSLSISDVVELYDDISSEYYFCDSFGYQPVQFDKAQVKSQKAERE